MSWNNRVVWSEGMFLRPQHFQQHDRYLETLVDGRCRSLLAGGWGFQLKLDDALLTQGKLAIVSARGVLPDGTPFNIPADDPAPAPLNVEESLRDGIVYLGLPLKRVGTRDTVEEGEALGGARYVSQVQEVRDDNAAFESRAPVALGSQAFRLLTERDGLGEYAAVGVARVREKRADQALSLDEDYLPPVLDIAAAPPLASFAKEPAGPAPPARRSPRRAGGGIQRRGRLGNRRLPAAATGQPRRGPHRSPVPRAPAAPAGACTANWWPWPASSVPSPPASGVPRSTRCTTTTTWPPASPR